MKIDVLNNTLICMNDSDKKNLGAADTDKIEVMEMETFVRLQFVLKYRKFWKVLQLEDQSLLVMLLPIDFTSFYGKHMLSKLLWAQI